MGAAVPPGPLHPTPPSHRRLGAGGGFKVAQKLLPVQSTSHPPPAQRAVFELLPSLALDVAA